MLSPPDDDEIAQVQDGRGSDADGETLRGKPNRSVYNIVLNDMEDEDVDNVSHSTRSYLEEDDVPLPVISDSESGWSRFGQCCDCMDACLRKRRWYCKINCGWLQHLVYYLILNLLPFAMFLLVIYMSVVNIKQNPDSPPFKQIVFKRDQYPGLSMVPSMLDIATHPLSMIWYSDVRSEDDDEALITRGPGVYIDKLADIIYTYKKVCKSAKPCNLNIRSLGPCNGSDFGYRSLQPCIFLRLNRLMWWMPEEYRQFHAIPYDVPEELMKVIDVTRARVWVHCKGETPFDEEKLGDIEYYPGPYFNSTVFPLSAFTDTNPVIAIRLPGVQPGYILKLKCGLFAKNVHEPNACHAFIYIKAKDRRLG